VRVVVAGGGYAGLACLIELRKLAPRAELHLLDPGPAHLKQTLLQEALRRPLDELRVPFDELGSRYGFEHHRHALGDDGVFAAGHLRAWHDATSVPVGTGRLAFDYLVIATGAQPRARAAPPDGRAYDQVDLREMEGERLVEAWLSGSDTCLAGASVVGGGPSGVQYAFELAHLLRRRGTRARLRLIDSESRLLRALPAGAHDYVTAQMQAAGIEYLPRTLFLGQRNGAMHVRALDDGDERDLASGLSLFFGGVGAHPIELHADRYGRVVLDGAALATIYAAGDCVRYAARGLDAMTAQAAVRKGKHVAANIARAHRERAPVPYVFQELGYIVGLGPYDAVGWVLVRENLLRGVAATAMRRLVEAQYDLFVEGLDTYVL
jgi:NADH dehydrogenase